MFCIFDPNSGSIPWSLYPTLLKMKAMLPKIRSGADKHIRGDENCLIRPRESSVDIQFEDERCTCSSSTKFQEKMSQKSGKMLLSNRKTASLTVELKYYSLYCLPRSREDMQIVLKGWTFRYCFPFQTKIS